MDILVSCDADVDVRTLSGLIEAAPMAKPRGLFDAHVVQFAVIRLPQREPSRMAFPMSAATQPSSMRLGRSGLLDLIILAANVPKSDRVEVSIPFIGTVAPSWTVSTNCLC
jgi:hypothetical protein